MYRNKILCLLSALLCVCASAAVARADVQHLKMRGKTAFSSYGTSDGCVFTDVFAVASESTQKVQPGAPTKSNATEITYVTQDICSSPDSLTIGFALIEGSATFQGNVIGATVNVSSLPMELFDCVSDELGFICTASGSTTVSAMLSWSATSSPERSVFISNSRTQSFSSKFRSTGSLRTADVAGSVSIGGVAFSFDDATGELLSNATSDLFLTFN